nr:zinc finger, CCHC-type [Tanacetum cinerariifolium]
MLQMKKDESVDTFTTKLTTLVNKAAGLGHTMEDETLVGKLLNVVPDRYLQIVASIEQYSDLDEMTLEEAIGRLKTYEEMIKYKCKQVDNQDRLLFTRYEEQGRRGEHMLETGPDRGPKWSILPDREPDRNGHEGPSEARDIKIPALILKFNVSKALEGGKPKIKDKQSTKDIVFVKAGESPIGNELEYDSDNESVNDNQEPLPPLPKPSRESMI